MLFSFIQRCKNKVKKCLAHPSMAFIAAGLGFVCMLSSINIGWYLDDYWHYLAYHSIPINHELMKESDRLNGPMRMFAFLDGNPDRNHRYIDIGGMPWWSNENLKLSFWRPLSVLTYQLDYWLWPDNAKLMHLQSLFWYVLVILASALFFRRYWANHWCIGIAVLLYALYDVHLMSATWLANRHTAIAALFGICALIFFIRWRKEKIVVAGYLSGLFFLMSMLSNESGVTIIAFIIAYEIYIEDHSWKEKSKILLPFILLILGWRIVYNFFGYGAIGSGFYIDPVRDPLRFAIASLERIPIQLWGLIAFPPADLYMLFSVQARVWYAGILSFLLLCIGWILYPFWKECRIFRFFTVSCFLSIIPLSAAIPSNRNLAIPALAFTGLIVQSMYRLSENKNLLPRKTIRRYSYYFGICILFLIHFLITPAGMANNPDKVEMMKSIAKRFTDIGVIKPELAKQDVIFVNPPCSFGIGYLIPNNIVNGLPIPAHIRVLSAGSNVEIERRDENTLIVRPENGYLKPVQPYTKEKAEIKDHVNINNILATFEELYRDKNLLMHLGQKVNLTGVSIEITAMTNDGRPAEASFCFNKPLEDPSLVWLQWKDGYEKFTLPAVGQKVWVDRGKPY